MTAAWRIAVKDLKLRLRDRSAIIVGIVAPLALAFIFNIIFGGVADEEARFTPAYGVVDSDGGEVAAGFVDVLVALAAEGVIELATFESSEAALAAVDSGDVDAVYLIPPGFSDVVGSGGSSEIQVVGDVDSPISSQVAVAIAEGFGSGATGVRVAVSTAVVASGGNPAPEEIDALATAAISRGVPYRITASESASRQLDATTFFAAGMAAFFLFFTVQFGVTGLLEEKQNGTLARLLAAPIPRYSVILAKVIVSFLLGLISMGVLIVATGALMGAQWGHPLGVTILVLAGVSSAVSVMALVAAFAKTAEGAGNLGSIVAVILGMLGGSFFPLGTGDDLLSRISLATPHSWFMRGLGDLTAEGSWTAALPAAGSILIIATVTGLAAAVFLRRQVEP